MLKHLNLALAPIALTVLSLSQKAAGKAAAINRKQTFTEAYAAEKVKTSALKSKTGKEKSTDLCDLLGRGC